LVTLKKDLRKELLKKRTALPTNIRKELDTKIVSNLLSLSEVRESEKVLLYCPSKGEPNIYPLLKTFLKQGKSLALPRVKGNEIEAVVVKDLRCLKEGAFNIPEPPEGRVIEPEELDSVVLPGIAFDREGNRLGFGKGFYDRLLKRVSAPKVGVAYSFQVLDSLPTDSWDVPVDVVVTEKEVIRR